LRENPALTSAGRPIVGGRRLSLNWIGVVPFLAYVAVFLLLPTGIIIFGAFLAGDGSATLSNFNDLSRSYVVSATLNSIFLSAVTAIVGAFFGALLAYAIATGNPRGTFRRAVTSACGVLAQFGGVILAFAFIAFMGPASAIYLYFSTHGLDYYAGGVWLYDLRGLELVYLYFQIPLMVLIFLPAVDGIKPQWREATESLGGGTWHYWRYVAGPLLAPAFLGSTLLLFANSLSAYATAAALINQGGPILPLQISNAITSEVGLHDPGFAKAQAVVLIVIVAIVSVLYAVLQRRTARWLQ
jgi:putative spermidine/putrescine transport system permease protein